MSTPFSDAIRHAPTSTWLDRVALSSLRAAETKFFPTYPRPLLTVALDDREADSWETARVTLAVQNATAKIAHLIVDPKSETAQARRAYREKAPLVPRGQSGATLYFGFPPPQADPAETPLLDVRVATLPEQAAVDLIGLLPTTREDDRALDAVLARRTTERSAISDLVRAVQDVRSGVHLEFTDHAGRSVESVLSQDQADSLEDSLAETSVDRRVITVTGTLDGMRTQRRLFFLIDQSGREISGGVDGDQLIDVRDHIGSVVQATIEEVSRAERSGRRSRPSHRLLKLTKPTSLFDEAD